MFFSNLTSLNTNYFESFILINDIGMHVFYVLSFISFFFLVNFCISLRVEISKVRLSLLSFISLIFIFFFIFINYRFIFLNFNEFVLFNLNTLANPNTVTNLVLDKINFNIFENTFRENYFFIFSVLLSSFFLLFLFLGFSDQQFLNQNKNFEFIWLLWLFFISAILLFLSWTFIEVFICLECLSFCSYILISLERSKKLSSISGIRYLIISAIPSVFLLLGIILIYKKNISFDLNFLDFVINSSNNIESIVTKYDYKLNPSEWLEAQNLITSNISNNKILYIDINPEAPYSELFINKNKNYTQKNFAENLFFNLTTQENFFNVTNTTYFYTLIFISIFFILSNLSFKLTAAPFHFWAPVIYNNGLLSSVIFLNVFLKLVIFLFLIIFINLTNNFFDNEIKILILIFSLLSFIFGSGGAINERFIKRFFVYSSMVDVGFILLLFSFYNLEKIKNILLYILIYNLSSMTIWFFLLCVRKHTKFITNLTNILNNNITLKFIFSFIIFSMAGIPPFAGFFIKYNVLKDILNFENFLISFFILFITILTLFYYLRLIKIIIFDEINFNVTTNLKNNNFKFLIFGFLFNILIFFLILMQESFIIFFDKLVLQFFMENFTIQNFVSQNENNLNNLTEIVVISPEEQARQFYAGFVTRTNSFLETFHQIDITKQNF